MKETFYPRLCGGTFFCLLIQFRKPRSAIRETYLCLSDGMSEPDMLTDLIRVASPSYNPPHASTMRNNTSRYKSCQLSAGAYLPFHDQCFIDSFDREIREHYELPDKRMHEFFFKFFEPMPSERSSRMVAALMELLESDGSIDQNQRLYVRRGGISPLEAITSSPSVDSFIIEALGGGNEFYQDGLLCTADGNGCDLTEHFSLRMFSKKVWNKRSQDPYNALCTALEEDDFPLKREYNALRQYYSDHLTKHSASNDDFFDQF